MYNYATSPQWLQECPKFMPKTAPSHLMITTPSNTPIPQPTPLTIPNGIRIQSAVFPQYTFWTDRHTNTNRLDDSSTPLALMLTILIESDTLKTEWWGVGMVICLGQGADLHLMLLPLTVSCCSKSRLVLPFWYWLTWVVPDKGPLSWSLFS